VNDLDDTRACARRNDRGRGTHIERAKAVATRAAHVDHKIALALHLRAPRVLTQDGDEGGENVRTAVRAMRGERGQEGAGLYRRHGVGREEVLQRRARVGGREVGWMVNKLKEEWLEGGCVHRAGRAIRAHTAKYRCQVVSIYTVLDKHVVGPKGPEYIITPYDTNTTAIVNVSSWPPHSPEQLPRYFRLFRITKINQPGAHRSQDSTSYHCQWQNVGTLYSEKTSRFSKGC
jgi:hypothetical protein